MKNLGGYHMVSLGDIPLTETSITFLDMYEKLFNNLGKPVLLTDININGNFYRDCYVQPVFTENGIIMTVGDYTITVTSEGSVSATSGIVGGGGGSPFVEIGSVHIENTVTTSIPQSTSSFVYVSSDVSGVTITSNVDVTKYDPDKINLIKGTINFTQLQGSFENMYNFNVPVYGILAKSDNLEEWKWNVRFKAIPGKSPGSTAGETVYVNLRVMTINYQCNDDALTQPLERIYQMLEASNI